MVPKSYSVTGDDHCSVVHLLISWWAEGVPDIGFSSCAAPTYSLVSEYFGVKSRGLGLMLKDIWQGCRCHARQHHELSGSGFSFRAEHPERSKVVHKVLAMNQVGHVLRVNL